jgi:CHAT domain-containing protein/Tfp pilus assembly protein PilF
VNVLLFGEQTAIAQEKDIHSLVLGEPITHELKGGQAHTYQINLAADQFLKVVVDQHGIDVVVTLFGPDGEQLVEMDSPNGTQGPEPVSVVTELSGTYQLEVRSLDAGAPPGRYEVKIDQLRNAQPLDNTRVAAERIAAQAVLLTAQGTAASMRAAVEKHGEALKLWRALGDSAMVAIAFNSIGGIYYYLGENQKALENFTATLRLKRALGDRRGEAEALNNLGTVYDSFGDKRKALDYYQQSLPYWQAVGDRQSEATLLNNIGLAHSVLGENQMALEYCSQALLLMREVGDGTGEAWVLTSIGKVCNELGERQKALDSHNQALLIEREIGDLAGEVGTLNHLGLLYNTLGEKQKALEYYDRSLQLARAQGDRMQEATALGNIGTVYDDLGDDRKALDYYEQALALRRAVGDRDGEAVTLNNIGVAYDWMGERQKALEYYERALPLLRAVGNRRIEAQTLSNIAEAYDKSGELQRALDYYHQALALARTVSDPAIEAIILFGIARTERQRGKLIAARTQFESALCEIESLRTRVTSQQLRASYFASKQHFYEFYLELLMQLHQLIPSEGHDAAAVQASERARARTLLELLGEARVDIRQGIDSVLVKHERTLQHLLNSKAERFTKLLSGGHTKADSAAAKKELNALLAEYQEIQASIRAASPRYAALTQPQPLSVKEIQQQVLDHDTVLLEYALGEERSFLWAVTPTILNSFELPKRAQIDSLARKVYDLLAARNQRTVNETPKQRRERLAQADAEYQKTAAILSQTVLGPAAAQLGAKRWLVVADGALQYLPFGALPVLQSTGYRPLALAHEIVSLPSASVLAVLRRELEKRNPASKPVAVLADPVFASKDSRVKRNKLIAAKNIGEQYAGLEVGRLPEDELERALRNFALRDTTGFHIPRLVFSRQEAEGILANAPAGETMKALDFAASRATATSAELSQYRMVHFATHGLLNSEHPELSGIVLSLVDEQGEPQNGFLRLHEIYNLNLPAELVVLSACQTALGKEIKGEGLIGLTRGFMYAGAACVVASLWKVDDEATAELMKRFYQKMLGPEKLRPAAALRAAQVSMWKEKRWQAPYYWAGFVLQGEWK